MIDQLTIDKVMETSQGRILDVVSEFVSLKKRGTNYIGNCPFHNEKTPSFIVSPHKGIFKCFGCGKGGNGVHFIMEHEQFSFAEAIRYLGKKFHIPIEEGEVSPEQAQLRSERESMMVVTAFAQKYFERTLFETDEGQSVGLSYFRQRGFRDDMVRKFQLGYSPEEKDAFTREAQKNSFKLEFLEKTGLTVVRDDYKADRFRGRVMFPIHNLAGKVIAFGGRVLKTDAKTAKYLNSPESELYHKSRILYGIYFAKQEIVKLDRCYLVEGYTDVISMHQAGITNVVASSGTALTQDQIRLIGRFTNNITILYDGDPAGIKASLRGIDLVLEEGMNVKVLLLPDGDDPDSFARKMPAEELRKYIDKHETDFIRFKTGLLLEESKSDPIKRATLIQDIVRTIFTIPDPIVRSVYVKECSAQLSVDEPILYAELGKLSRKKLEQESMRRPVEAQAAENQLQQPPSDAFVTQNPYELEEREVLRFLLKHGNRQLTAGEQPLTVGEFILQELKQDDLRSVKAVYNRVLQLYEENMDQVNAQGEQFFINHSDIEVSTLAADLVTHPYTLSKIHKRFADVKSEEDLLLELVPKTVMELKYKKVKVLIHEKRQVLKNLAPGDDVRVIQLLTEINQWQQIFSVICKELGDRTIV